MTNVNKSLSNSIILSFLPHLVMTQVDLTKNSLIGGQFVKLSWKVKSSIWLFMLVSLLLERFAVLDVPLDLRSFKSVKFCISRLTDHWCAIFKVARIVLIWLFLDFSDQRKRLIMCSSSRWNVQNLSAVFCLDDWPFKLLSELVQFFELNVF